jgi:hypothetical protein
MINQISGYGSPGRNQYGGMQGVGGQGRGLGRAMLQQAVQSGAISREDAQQIRAQGQQLKQSIMADGQVTPEERSQMQAYRQQMMQMLSQFGNTGATGTDPTSAMTGMNPVGGCQSSCQGGAMQNQFVPAMAQMGMM